jgi:hypothetical protein
VEPTDARSPDGTEGCGVRAVVRTLAGVVLVLGAILATLVAGAGLGAIVGVRML